MNLNNEQSIDVYSIVTDRIIELLEAGSIPWQKPWTTGGISRNLLSKRPGIPNKKWTKNISHLSYIF